MNNEFLNYSTSLFVALLIIHAAEIVESRSDVGDGN